MAPAVLPAARLACTTTSRLGPGLRNVKANSPTVSNTVCRGSMRLLCRCAALPRMRTLRARQFHRQPDGVGQERRTVALAATDDDRRHESIRIHRHMRDVCAV